MKGGLRRSTGVSGLYRCCQRAFRTTENLDYYSPEDYKRARRKFMKLGLTQGFETEDGLNGP